MTILALLEQVAAAVTAEDFHAACAHLGQFAATQAASFQFAANAHGVVAQAAREWPSLVSLSRFVRFVI